MDVNAAAAKASLGRSMAKESFLIDGQTITVRMSSAALRALDDWRQKQTDTPGRPEAICRLVEQLTLADARPTTDESQNKAAELASREMDKLGAKIGHGQERSKRKRHLIKGPIEFRQIRARRTKSKK
jgi:hypothetical protein